MVKLQQLQRFEDGKKWSMATTDRPAHSPLYWSWRTSSLQLASAIALDSDGLRIMFFTLRDSTQTTWFSLISLRVALCKASIRQFSRGVGPPLSWLWRGSLSLWLFCFSVRRAAYLAVWRGLPDLNPVSVTNKSFKLTSIPTVEGVNGKGRGQRTSNGVLLFAIYRLPSRYLNALAVNSAACLWHLLLNAGYAARPAKKLENAACWWRSDCCIGTQETSFSQANSGTFFSAVNRCLFWRS